MKKEAFKKIPKIILFYYIGLTLFTSCSKDDGESPVEFYYASETYEVEFRSQGTIPAPIIEWPDEKGTFSLKSENRGMYIDETNGQIQIERFLDIGEHEVTVMARDNKKAWETTFKIKSVLKDSFWSGGQNNDNDNDALNDPIAIDRLLWLFDDGTLEIEIAGEAGSKGVGTWSMDGNVFKVHFCTYCEDMDPRDIPNYDGHTLYEGILVNDKEEGASIRGRWYVIGFDPDSVDFRGEFVLFWD